MNRNFNIVLPNNQVIDKNLINIDINNLSTIINCSADTVVCSCLEYLDSSKLESSITDIMGKIKPGGKIIFKIIDFKQHSLDFINGSISGQELLDKIKYINSLLSIEDIYTKIDSNTMKVVQIYKENKTITIVLERIAL